MNKKPKRIRAEINRGITRDRDMYVLWRGDIRALAEQMVRSSVEWYKLPQSAASSPRALAAALHCLKRAGMTPGKGTQ
jgi:hypothetical protein